MRLGRKLKITVFLLVISLSQLTRADVPTIAISGSTTHVEVSNVNPNRFHCVNGDINDVNVPGHIHVDPKISGNNVFLGYKILKKGNDMKYVSVKHTLHITCDGKVYSFLANPTKTATAAFVQLGDKNLDRLEANAQLLREKSVEDLGTYLINSAYSNSIPSNITVSTKTREYTGLVDWVMINEVRQLKLEGAGLTLREFVLRASPGKNVQKELFIKKELSDKIWLIATHPQKANSKGYARLFIVEQFL